MVRSSLAALLSTTLLIGMPVPGPAAQQAKSRLAGRWAINRQSSEFPREIGFGSDLVAGTTSGSDSGGRGRGGSGGASNPFLTSRRESEDDAKRAQQLTNEARDPSVSLTIVETATAVTITDDRGQSRTVHPNGKEEILQLDQVPVMTTTKWDTGRLVVLYKVEEGRELRYTYSTTGDPLRLIVDVQFIERGGHDAARRVYDAVSATAPLPVRPAPVEAAPKPATAIPSAASASDLARLAQAAPADSTANPVFSQEPDAELKGLTRLGVEVEALSPKAVACGLNQATIEGAVSKSLSDSGLKIIRNTDDDTYLYVSIVTATVSTGLCVSRYDVSLYTHTTARLSYRSTPVLVQVELLHKGGMAGGSPAAHAESVLKDLKQSVDQFASRIRDANK